MLTYVRICSSARHADAEGSVAGSNFCEKTCASSRHERGRGERRLKGETRRAEENADPATLRQTRGESRTVDDIPAFLKAKEPGNPQTEIWTMR